MSYEDIVQKLALLPERLDEENLQTWQRAIKYYQEKISNYPGSRLNICSNWLKISQNQKKQSV